MTRRYFKYRPGLLLAAVAALSMAVLASGPTSAAGYPDHDITFIVPYSPGGGSDH